MKIAALALCALAPLATPLAGGGADDVREVDILELTKIDWKPGMRLPDEIRELDGERIRLKGYMNVDTEEGVNEFLLTFDGCGCSALNPHHWVEVTLSDDRTRYTPEVVVVEGRIDVGEKREDGFVVSLYRMVAKEIETPRYGESRYGEIQYGASPYEERR